MGTVSVDPTEAAFIFEFLKARIDRLAPAAQSLWLIPSISMLLMMALAAVLANVDIEVPKALDALVYTGDASAARDILATTAGAVSATVTLTLTLTVVALQLVSSQFSPRILRNYLSDRTSKAVVSLLLGTFAFALVTLFYVRSPNADGEGAVVPAISISLLLGLAVLSLIGLVVFIHNLTQSLRIENVIDTITRETLATIKERAADTDIAPGEELVVPTTARAVTAERHGYVLDYDIDEIVERLSGLGVSLRTVPSIGEHLAEGGVAAWAWHTSDEQIDDEMIDQLRETLNRTTKIAPNRAVTSDAAFGVRQLVDIAIRALSPGINDPTTANAALARVSTLLHRMVEVGFSEGRIYRGEDCVVQVGDVKLVDILEVAITQPAIYGSGDPMVMRQILRMLGELGRSASTPSERETIRGYVHLVGDIGEEASTRESFRLQLVSHRLQALGLIDGTPTLPSARLL